MFHILYVSCRASGAKRDMMLPAVLTALAILCCSVTARAAWETIDHSVIFDNVGSVASNEVRSCSDGQGGMIVAVVNATALPRVWLSRIDHTGTKLWGDQGVAIPWSVGAEDQITPMDVAPDGSGGAYCAFMEDWPSANYIVVAHVTAAGVFDWKTYVSDCGTPTETMYPAIVLEDAGEGAVIVGWLNAVLADEKVVVAKVDASGAILWLTPIEPGVHTELNTINWRMASDGQGGVLVTCWDYPFPQPYRAYMQRVSGAGSLLWGSNGTTLDPNYFYGVSSVVQDGFGGAWVTQRDVVANEIRVQHFDATGIATLAGGGVSALPYDYLEPVICEDGGGGVFVFAVHDPGVSGPDIAGQHVGAGGDLIWGGSGLTIADLPGSQKNVRICHDGFGGVIVGWEDWYWVEHGSETNRLPSGKRLDGFGSVLWERVPLWWDGMNDGMEPRVVVPVADGSGGAMFNWSECGGTSSFNTDVLMGLGVGPSGDVPKPILTYIWADAGEPGDVLPVAILGDYLNTDQGFKLQGPNKTDIPITGLAAGPDFRLIEGLLDLTGAVTGSYDLVVSQGSVPQDTLVKAFGVGSPPDCTTDEPFETPEAQALSSGSLRKAAFGPDGTAHMVWLDYDAGQYRVYKWRGDDDGEYYALRYNYTAVTRDVSLAVGPDGRAHYCFVVEDGGEERLYYFRENPAGSVEQLISGPITDGIDNPTLAVDAAGTPHIVYEGDIMGNSWLFHMTAAGTEFEGPWDMMAGPNAREPDLTRYGDGLMVTYVRDFWIPWLREVCYQRATEEEYGWNWSSAVGYYWGLIVTSPSVAWDGGEELLFSFMLDNTGSAPLNHTCKMVGGEQGAVRWRAGDGLIYRSCVAASGPGSFVMLTQESGTGIPMNIYLRRGDGEVFFPRQRVNVHDDVDMSFLAAGPGGGLFAFWEDYETVFPYSRYYCQSEVSAVDPDAPLLPAHLDLAVCPNPFNATTRLSVDMPRNSWAKLLLFDLRGRRVRLLTDELLTAGHHDVAWDGCDERGQVLSSGIYFARLELSDGTTQVKKVTLVK